MSASICVRLLGPSGVELAGTAVRLTRQQRALMSILALQPGRLVTVERMIDGLWDERAPVSARNVIQVQMSKVRAALGEAASLIASQPHGYVMSGPGVDSDLRRLSELDAVTRHRSWHSTDTAWRELRELCARPPLEDLRDQPFAAGIVPALEEQQLVLTERRLGAQVQAGDDAVVVELEELVVAHPYRERFTGLLMRAHQMAGRQADALAAFQRTKRLLSDDLGLDPSTELKRLQQDVLTHTLPTAAPPERAQAWARRETSPLVGRDSDVAAVEAMVAQSALVTVVGPGGVGKTRLALKVATRAARRFDDVFFVELADLTSLVQVGAEIARCIGVAGGTDAWAAVESRLAHARLFLVLDNVEQLDRIGRQIARLVRDLTRSRVLVTSRRPVHVREERVRVLGPLSADDAAELFCQRLAAFAPERVPDRRIVDELCERLDRLPLALEVAAAGCRRMSPEDLLDRLDDAQEFALLEDLPERQRTLAANIDWSLGLLSSQGREALASAAVFAGSFTRESAVEVLGEGANEALSELVDSCLLTLESSRLRMPQVVRRHAVRALAVSRDERVVRERHARWVRREVTTSSIGAFSALLPEVTAALASHLQRDEPEPAARLVLDAAPAWQQLDEDLALTEMAAWLSVVLAADVLDRSMRLRLLLLRQDRYFRLGRLEECRRDTVEALSIAEATGDQWGLARACHALAYRAFLEGRLDEALARCDQGEAAAELAGDKGLFVRFRHVRGSVARAAGRVDEAVAHLTALAASPTQDDRARCFAFVELADTLVAAGRFAHAERALDQAWQSMPGGNDPQVVIATLLAASLALRSGDVVECLRSVSAVHSTRKPLAMRSDLVSDVVLTAAALLELGESSEALELTALADRLERAVPAARIQYASMADVAAALRVRFPARTRRGVPTPLVDVSEWQQVSAYVSGIANRVLSAHASDGRY